MAEADYSRDSPLILYVAYEYLPAIQHGTLTNALGAMYEAILWHGPKPDSFLVSQSPWPNWPGLYPTLGPPLCITEVHTGDSIRIKFDAKGHWLPRFRFPHGDLEVLLPRWTAAVVLVGTALTGVTAGATGVLHGYNQYLIAQKSQLEIEKLQQEIQQFDLKGAEEDPRFQIPYQEFRLAVDSPNIREATINGLPIHRRTKKPRQ
jgi:hypothetical protein